MFISALELFKIGIGPSSSHTMGPMIAATIFTRQCSDYLAEHGAMSGGRIRCLLKGSLAFTGKGHYSDRAVALGIHGYSPEALAKEDIERIVSDIWLRERVIIKAAKSHYSLGFQPDRDIVFDTSETLPEHPNGMVFELLDGDQQPVLSETFFSIGGGFINTLEEVKALVAPLKMQPADICPYPFGTATSMLEMSRQHGLSIAQMKRINECDSTPMSEAQLNQGLDKIWQVMCDCIEAGLRSEGVLPGGLQVKRRAAKLRKHIVDSPEQASLNDWLCVYAMAVNEENAAGHRVVTAPTNGAAGVIPAVLYYYIQHELQSVDQQREKVYEFLLTASAIGGIIKHRSSISGAEVGCQGEVGSASAMAAAGLCAVRGGTTEQIEHAAEIALEHHLGMTCDPVKGLVQVPCIERNGFGAIKAYTAAMLSQRGDGEHIMSLDNCIDAMRRTGLDMSSKYKETSLGGLAVSITEC